MSTRHPSPGKLPPAPPTPAVPRGRRRREGYRYYLEDHPVLGPVITLALGGLCLYLSIFTNIMQGWLAGPGATRSSLDNVNTVIAWGIAFVVAIMALSLMFLIWQLLESGHPPRPPPAHRLPAVRHHRGPRHAPLRPPAGERHLLGNRHLPQVRARMAQ